MITYTFASSFKEWNESKEFQIDQKWSHLLLNFILILNVPHKTLGERKNFFKFGKDTKRDYQVPIYIIITHIYIIYKLTIISTQLGSFINLAYKHTKNICNNNSNYSQTLKIL